MTTDGALLPFHDGNKGDGKVLNRADEVEDVSIDDPFQSFQIPSNI